MNDLKPANHPTSAEKPGFFKRIFGKMDEAMKAKAEEKAKGSCCAGDSKGKGGKCC